MEAPGMSNQLFSLFDMDNSHKSREKQVATRLPQATRHLSEPGEAPTLTGESPDRDRIFAPTSTGETATSAQPQWREEKIAAITRGLNPAQLQAVTHRGGPLLVMAGAGSGKTRVLTRRIAYLLATDQVRPWEILAITFTNKAAQEMRERVEALVGNAAGYMWVSTFHSACVRILRSQAEVLGISRSFSIYDAADSKALITRIVKERGLDPKRFSPKGFAAKISNAKNELRTPSQYAAQAGSTPAEELAAEIYAEYQSRLRQANAFDFDDLIAQVVYLWRSNPQVLAQYRQKFRHVLVDEYQDTNPAQYELVRALTLGQQPAPGAELTVVGDSDQSIYAFRGATIRNIEEFEQDFPGARTVFLEQNYRSTGTILSVANAIISENQHRCDKNLWTDAGDGAKAVLFAADTERDEAAFIVREMRELHEGSAPVIGGGAGEPGLGWDDFAVFYRTNAQSRSLEEMLTREGIPYRVVGGTKFYDRKEVKDALAYLTAAANPADDGNLLRIINEPRRGLGDAALAKIRAVAVQDGSSFIEALHQFLPGGAHAGELAGKAGAGAAAVAKLLNELRQMDDAGSPLDEILDFALESSGYLGALRASKDPQDDARIENLAELHTVAQEFSLCEPDARLADFLERIALVADTDQLPDQGQDHPNPQATASMGQSPDLATAATAATAAADATLATASTPEPAEAPAKPEVTLMTVHTAKGLEFNTVFVTGMEDGLFPHSRSLDDPDGIEEERRLAYVAVTRARKRLYLTRSGSRAVFGDTVSMPESRFLGDIPAQLLDARRAQTTTDHYASLASSGGSGDSWSSRYSGGGYGGSRYQGRSGGYGASGRREGEACPKQFKNSAYRLSSAADLVKDTPSAAQVAARKAAAKPAPAKSAEQIPQLHVGQRVTHDIYGVGKVIGLEGSGTNSIAKVKFTSGSTKRLLLKFAPLSVE